MASGSRQDEEEEEPGNMVASSLGQAKHSVLAEDAEEKNPAKQVLQKAEPSSEEKRPGGQERHVSVPAGRYMPAGQAVHPEAERTWPVAGMVAHARQI